MSGVKPEQILQFLDNMRKSVEDALARGEGVYVALRPTAATRDCPDGKMPSEAAVTGGTYTVEIGRPARDRQVEGMISRGTYFKFGGLDA